MTQVVGYNFCAHYNNTQLNLLSISIQEFVEYLALEEIEFLLKIAYSFVH